MGFIPIDNETYEKYKSIALKMFYDLNGRINSISSNCYIELDNYDFVTNSYGEFIYPIRIRLYLCSIIKIGQKFSEKHSHNIILTTILFTLIHELFHSEQKMIMDLYASNGVYKKQIENTNDMKTVIYMLLYKNRHETEYGFTYNFATVDVPGSVINLLGYTRDELAELSKEINRVHYCDTLESYYKNWLANLLPGADLTQLDRYNGVELTITFVDDPNKEYRIILKQLGSYKEADKFNEVIYQQIKKYDIVLKSFRVYTMTNSIDPRDNKLVLVLNIHGREYTMREVY